MGFLLQATQENPVSEQNKTTKSKQTKKTEQNVSHLSWVSKKPEEIILYKGVVVKMISPDQAWRWASNLQIHQHKSSFPFSYFSSGWSLQICIRGLPSSTDGSVLHGVGCSSPSESSCWLIHAVCTVAEQHITHHILQSLTKTTAAIQPCPTFRCSHNTIL